MHAGLSVMYVCMSVSHSGLLISNILLFYHLSQLRLREEVGVPVPVGVEQLLPWRYREVMAERRAAPPPPLTAPCTAPQAEEWPVAFATTSTATSCTSTATSSTSTAATSSTSTATASISSLSLLVIREAGIVAIKVIFHITFLLLARVTPHPSPVTSTITTFTPATRTAHEGHHQPPVTLHHLHRAHLLPVPGGEQAGAQAHQTTPLRQDVHPVRQEKDPLLGRPLQGLVGLGARHPQAPQLLEHRAPGPLLGVDEGEDPRHCQAQVHAGPHYLNNLSIQMHT